MYKVIKFFTDLHDNEYPYNVGELFPREGMEVSENRLVELSGSDNKQGVPLIEFIAEPAEPDETVPETDELKKPAPNKKRGKADSK